MFFLLFGSGKKKKKQASVPVRVTKEEVARDAVREYPKSLNSVAEGRTLLQKGDYKLAIHYFTKEILSDAQEIKIFYDILGKEWPYDNVELYVRDEVIDEIKECYLKLIKKAKSAGKYDKALEYANEAYEYASKSMAPQMKEEIKMELTLLFLELAKAEKNERAEFEYYRKAFALNSDNEEVKTAFNNKLAELENRAANGGAIDILTSIYTADGIFAIDAKAFPRPLEIIKEQAKKGNGEAEYWLGHFYTWGYAGLPQNSKLAIQWYKSAAKHGNKDAKWTLKESRFAMGFKTSAFLIFVILAGIALGAIKLFPVLYEVEINNPAAYTVLAVLGAVLVTSIISIYKRRYLLILIYLLLGIGGAYIFFTKKDAPTITTISTTTAIVNTNTLNLRTEPSANATSVAKLKKGDKLNVTGKDSNGWTEVEYSGKKGYVNTKYITINY